jgi:hypothetical protein
VFLPLQQHHNADRLIVCGGEFWHFGCVGGRDGLGRILREGVGGGVGVGVGVGVGGKERVRIGEEEV